MPEEIPVVKVAHTVLTSVTCNVDLRGSDLSCDIHSLQNCNEFTQILQVCTLN